MDSDDRHNYPSVLYGVAMNLYTIHQKYPLTKKELASISDRVLDMCDIAINNNKICTYTTKKKDDIIYNYFNSSIINPSFSTVFITTSSSGLGLYKP